MYKVYDRGIVADIQWLDDVLMMLFEARYTVELEFEGRVTV
jgi:hypothetical protein